jgi:glycosyltransferase involved in cell wall biosynthesis
VANFRPQKGHDMLLAAFAEVVRELPDASLVLVGDGALSDGLAAQARTLGIASSVRFEGTVPEVWPLLAQADVFALASRYEPLGLAALEAMAAGLPVVATGVGGLRDLVEPGVTGELVDPDDARGLAERLVALLRAPSTLAAMGAAGRERAAAHGADRMAEQYLGLYEELLEAEVARA